VIKPKKPLVEWANAVGQEDLDIDLNYVQQDCTTYLVNDVIIDNLEDFLKENYLSFFEYELWSWFTDETTWPTNPSFKMFCEWFDVEVHSMIIDLFDHQPLSHEFEV
jgi:hypothetical protein